MRFLLGDRVNILLNKLIKWELTQAYVSYYILLYLRKFVHNAADLLDAHIVPMR